jgi:twinkle protein
VMYRLMRQANAGEKPNLEHAMAVRDHLKKHIWLVDKQGKVPQEVLFQKLAYAVARYDVSHLVIDPLAKCGISEDDYNWQKEFVEALTDFAHEHNVHCHLIVHTKKRESEKTKPDKMDVKGSGGMIDMTDNAFIVYKNVRKKDIKDLMNDGLTFSCMDEDQRTKAKKTLQEPDLYLKCVKQRNGEWEGTINLWFNEQTLQFLESENETPIVYVSHLKAG